MSVYTSLKQPLEGLAALNLSDNDILQFEQPNDVAVSRVVRYAPDLVKRHHQKRQFNRPLLIPAAELEENTVALNELGVTNSLRRSLFPVVSPSHFSSHSQMECKQLLCSRRFLGYARCRAGGKDAQRF